MLQRRDDDDHPPRQFERASALMSGTGSRPSESPKPDFERAKEEGAKKPQKPAPARPPPAADNPYADLPGRIPLKYWPYVI